MAADAHPAKRVVIMQQCQSHIFFPDDPSQPPQFSDCPRVAETRRRTFRIGDRANGEPPVVNAVKKLCGTCAREWDGKNLGSKRKVKAVAA